MGVGFLHAQTVLDVYQGPRQFAMGGAGVALPDRGRSSNFNPALPAFSFPENQVGVGLHPTWRDTYGDGIRFKDWNAPMLPFMSDQAGYWESLAGLPAVYFPRLGYIGLDKQRAVTFFAPDADLEGYSLTLSLAEDFLDWKGLERDSAFDWTVGMSLKRYYTRFVSGDEVTGFKTFTSKGFAFDMGWASRWTRIPFIDGLLANFGLAFQNLGPDQFIEENAYSNYSDPLPQEYRLGWSLEYRPLDQLVLAQRKWTPVRVIATQEFQKRFGNPGRDSQARPFFLGFFKDFDKPAMRYWRETYVNMGAELTIAEILYLRGGRGQSSFNWSEPTWAFGYGLSSGPLFKRFYFGYDYARVLSMGVARGNEFSSVVSPREYGFQVGYLF